MEMTQLTLEEKEQLILLKRELSDRYHGKLPESELSQLLIAVEVNFKESVAKARKFIISRYYEK